MAKLRVFFYGLVAFVRHSADGTATVILLDKNDDVHGQHHHHHHHAPHIGFDANDTLISGKPPVSISVDCTSIKGWNADIKLLDVKLSYTLPKEDDPAAQAQPGGELPENPEEGRQIKWVPKSGLVVPGHSRVDENLIRTGIGSRAKLAARISLSQRQFDKLNTCRLVEHKCEPEDWYEYDIEKSVHAFDFKSHKNLKEHAQALAEVVVIEDELDAQGVTLDITNISTGSTFSKVRLEAGSNGSVDVFFGNLADEIKDKCKEREMGHHFSLYYDILREVPNPAPIPHVAKNRKKKASDVRPDCSVKVVCEDLKAAGDEDSSSVSREAVYRDFFEISPASINSRPVCPMIVVED